MKMVPWLVLAALVAGAVACSGPEPSASEPPAAGPSAVPTGARPSVPATLMPIGTRPLRYVALGDSYTLGARVRLQDNWPNQLVRALDGEIPMVVTANLAQSGRTSQDVIDEQLWVLRTLRPELVSLLVGANDVIAPEVGPDDYRANVATILDALLAELPAQRIFVVTTPDHTLTPRGGDYGDPVVQRAGIAEANAILGEEAASRGIHVIDIGPISSRVADDPSLVAPDGLHPSAKQFAGWVEIIAPQVRALLLGDPGGAEP